MRWKNRFISSSCRRQLTIPIILFYFQHLNAPLLFLQQWKFRHFPLLMPSSLARCYLASNWYFAELKNRISNQTSIFMAAESTLATELRKEMQKVYIRYAMCISALQRQHHGPYLRLSPLSGLGEGLMNFSLINYPSMGLWFLLEPEEERSLMGWTANSSQ